MHNLVSFNQLSGSYEDEHDSRLTEYYECLIECDDTQSVCKRICKEVLLLNLIYTISPLTLQVGGFIME